jgi:exosortase A-associated hydrolase 1
MGASMRRLLSFECEGAALGATLDEAAGATGILFAVGGTQTRIGSHRMFERLAGKLAEAGYACFRFDRRGVGDSGGEEPGWRGSGPDLAAAAAAFRAECPHVTRIVGLGLCDGASALALFGADAGVDGIVLINPWLVETQENAPAPAAIRRHYWERLTSIEGWKKILSGSIDYRKLFAGVKKAGSDEASGLAGDVAASLKASRLPAELILASGDATAVAAEHELARPAFGGLVAGRQTVATDSHTFARPDDESALLVACLEALRRL